MGSNNNYKHINYAETLKIMDGRKYINEENVIYYLPSDKEESDRLNIEHYLLRYIWQGNFSPKIEKGLIKGNKKVIDLGCGAEQCWLIDMSLKYPLSTFIGIDIVATPSLSQDKPENLAFLQHNLLEHPGVPFPDETFDFVYMRNLGFTIDNWIHVINEAARVTNSNGYIEIANYDVYRDIKEDNHGGPIYYKLHCSCMYIQYIYIFYQL